MAKMTTPKIQTTEKIVPMIYAYTTPGVTYHDGCIKIGYTEQDVDKRISDQTHTAGIHAKKEWQGTAIFDDGSGDTFKDTQFHDYLRANGIKQPQEQDTVHFKKDDKNEWFITSPAESRGMFYDFKANRGINVVTDSVTPYTLRKEQEEAVAKAAAYFASHENGEFLFNCKPRFGKVLTTYELAKRIGAVKVLIVTNRPAIANSWYDDYVRFMGTQSGYYFVSETDSLKGRSSVITREEYIKQIVNAKDDTRIEGIIQFVSLQDMKGSIYFGGQYDKLSELSKKSGYEWDLLVIDEAHEGVDTYRTDVAFNQVARKHTLHLSGTPFKALASAKFPSDAIFNWTYADEQQARAEWDPKSQQENPYEELPHINLYTYQMSELIRDELSRGIEINGETEEYAFDLNEFFRVEGGKFVYNSSVDRFLDALTTQKKFPFSTEELRSELNHTFWLLNRVESARQLAKKLQEHPVFKDYEVVLAAGDGKIDDEKATAKSFDKVRKAIEEHEKTITLSVGQLTTGVTIPEWTGVLILSNIASPSLYMQAAFRAQNPCLFQKGTEYFRKENAYVFDFDPARTLDIYEQFANDLTSTTAGGHGDLETRKANIRKFLNFFPVIGEDEDGELVELDADQVLTIPRKIRSLEVVRRGFMSNFLFQNISQIFGAPKELMDILDKLTPAQEQKTKAPELPKEIRDELSVDDDGNVTLTDEYVIGKSAEIFGGKIEDLTARIEQNLTDIAEAKPEEQKASTDALKEAVKQMAKEHIVEKVADSYQEDIEKKDLKQTDLKRLEGQISDKVDHLVDKQMAEHAIEQRVLEKERKEEMQRRDETGRTTEDIEAEYAKKKEENDKKFQQQLTSAVSSFFEEQKKESVKTVETTIKERQKRTVEDGVRDHLRGFSRTIPSFLMAYGDDTVTLATFDTKVPDQVFLDVTSITMEEFRCLRDGKWTDPETGETKEYSSGLFDEVVFDDSIKEFLSLKKKLADYFDEKAVEDIFDYIPPQKTFQIFTPKNIVKMMVDKLEEENPGCFDDPDKTFIDLYMKSGLYPAEIVKRLYQSPKLKELYPDGNDRLRHIFEKQVYGLAPTQIIYDIAISFILGCYENPDDIQHNFRMADAVPYVKEGKLPELLDMLYPDD